MVRGQVRGSFLPLDEHWDHSTEVRMIVIQGKGLMGIVVACTVEP